MSAGADAPRPGPDDDTTPRSAALGAAGWLLLLALLGYTAWLHQGVGAPPGGIPSEDWHPSRFLLESEFVGGLEERPRAVGTLTLALPAAILAVGVFLLSRSAVARCLAVSGVLVCALFGFYGLYAPRVWEFFHWRGSLVIVSVGLAVGAAITAPLLAARWRRLAWPWQLALYLPLFAVVVAMLRHTTGTDERLAFNFSPWPAVTIFGLELGAYAVAGFLLCLALGSLGWSLWRERRTWGVLCVVAAVAIPGTWLLGRFGSLPPNAHLFLALPTVVGLGLTALGGGPDRAAGLRRRAFHLALGAVLIYAPLFVGRALSTGDYTVMRFVRAQAIIDALGEHYQEEEVYPDELVELIERGYLDEIPRPRVGFELLYQPGPLEPLGFHYQSLGSSYVLEFVFTEWVQCAYNPPWEDDYDYDYDEEEEGDAAGEASDGDESDGELDEAWSCPESRPELW